MILNSLIFQNEPDLTKCCKISGRGGVCNILMQMWRSALQDFFISVNLIKCSEVYSKTEKKLPMGKKKKGDTKYL